MQRDALAPAVAARRRNESKAAVDELEYRPQREADLTGGVNRGGVGRARRPVAAEAMLSEGASRGGEGRAWGPATARLRAATDEPGGRPQCDFGRTSSRRPSAA